MRTSIKQMWIVLVVTAACQAQLSVAEDNSYLNSKGVSTAVFVGDEKPAQADVVCEACAACGQAPCACLDKCGSCKSCLPLGCADCPAYSLVGIFGIDSFQGYSDLLQSNFGAVTGVNAGAPIPGLRDAGIGWQLGATYGVYDFDGRLFANQSTSQQQIFVTTGFFHKAQEGQRVSFGAVYDWMLNNDWGYFATSPTLGQWRAQGEYALSNCNAVGVYGSMRDRWSSQEFDVEQRGVVISTRAISQVSLFWHHKFDECGADTRLWFGVPEHLRYDNDGSLIDWVVGASAEVPLSDCLALYANAQYGHPSASASEDASFEQYYNVGAGIVWYFGCHARKCSINGNCWQPYMPMANNSNFLVEQGFTAVFGTPAP